jgi:periplasmic protein TonB
MAASNPAVRAPAGLVPYYRRYDLPWSPSEETERRFRTILRNLAIAASLIALIMPFLPRHVVITNTESLPERVVQLVMEPPPPPPPPPPPKPEKPIEKVPVEKVPVPVDPRTKALKMLAPLDDLAALRQIDLDKFAKDQKKTNDPGDTNVTRSLITSKVGGSSGGISAPTSSGLASGSGSLHGISTTQVKDPNLGAGGQAATRAGGSGKASRSADEIALVFTKNKGAIDALYARALRDNPALQGKVVIEMTISPTGDITAARIISSELNDPEFESKLLARIRLFKFDARDVAALTATKPIDFFPAG